MLDQRGCANKLSWNSHNRARTKSKQSKPAAVNEKVIKRNQRSKKKSNHRALWSYSTWNHFKLLLSKHISLMLRELQSENKEHILANCWSHIKISMWDMLLYPNHMARLREAVRIQLLYQNTATPVLILSLISLMGKCRKQNVSRNCALGSWDKITMAKRYLFCEQNAHKCLWTMGSPAAALPLARAQSPL